MDIKLFQKGQCDFNPWEPKTLVPSIGYWRWMTETFLDNIEIFIQWGVV